MKCYHHVSTDGSGTCMDCGRGLCVECLNKYNRPVCNFCCEDIATDRKKRLLLNLVLTAFFALAGFGYMSMIMQGELSLSHALPMMYIFCGIPWGWNLLTRITPQVFLFMPIVGWIMYFVLKLSISTFVGIFAFPYVLIKGILEWRSAKLLKQAAESN